MSFKIKRDETTTLAPALNQVNIGELVLNVQTGTLYTKKRDENGNETIVKFISSPLSSSGSSECNLIPTISFGDVANFCCNGSVLAVTINNLIVGAEYTYRVEDLVQNSVVIFSQTNGNIIPNNSSSRHVPVSINISAAQPNAIIKFSVYSTPEELQSEAIINICCQNCSAN